MAVTVPSGKMGIVGGGSQKNYTSALTVLTSLFFIWGFITCLNDILIPHLKSVFDLNYTQSMLIQLCFFAAYFIMSIPAGLIVEKLGYKNGIVIGLATTGFGALLFYPAAIQLSYAFFLVALFVLASGITLLQVAANPYVTILGKPETASSRLNLTQAFNSLGTTIAPYLGSLVILGTVVESAEKVKAMTADQKHMYQLTQIDTVKLPYIIIALVLFAIAAFFAFVKLPEVKGSTVEGATNAPADTLDHLHTSAWGYKHLVLGAIGIFVYVGGEVSIGSFLVNYFGLKEIGGLQEADAGKLVSFYWGGAMIGRFLGSYIQRLVSPGKVLAFNAAMAVVLVITSMMTFDVFARWSILSVGLFNSIMFPTIFSLALAKLGKHTGQGSGILCAAIVGGALLPVFQGMIADKIGLHHAFILPVLCYLYIAYYGWMGHVPEKA